MQNDSLIKVNTEGAEDNHEAMICAYDMVEDTRYEGFFRVEGMEGPYTLALKGSENSIDLVITNSSGAEKIVGLPLRQWKPEVLQRKQIIAEYTAAIGPNGNAEEGARMHSVRKQHHDAATAKLQKECEDMGVTMDPNTARNLFDFIAEMTGEKMSQGVWRYKG